MLRIRDVYPGSHILIFTHPGSWIPDPKTVTKERGEKNVCQTFFCSHKFHKNVNYFIFEMLKKKILANFQRITELFTQKLSLSSQKYGVGIRDPEKTHSGFRIPDLRVKKAPDLGSGSARLHFCSDMDPDTRIRTYD